MNIFFFFKYLFNLNWKANDVLNSHMYEIIVLKRQTCSFSGRNRNLVSDMYIGPYMSSGNVSKWVFGNFYNISLTSFMKVYIKMSKEHTLLFIKLLFSAHGTQRSWTSFPQVSCMSLHKIYWNKCNINVFVIFILRWKQGYLCDLSRVNLSIEVYHQNRQIVIFIVNICLATVQGWLFNKGLCV